MKNKDKVRREIEYWKVKGFQKTYVRIMTGFSDCPLQIGTGALDAFSSGNSKTLKKFYSILELIALSLAQFLENQKASDNKTELTSLCCDPGDMLEDDSQWPGGPSPSVLWAGLEETG